MSAAETTITVKLSNGSSFTVPVPGLHSLAVGALKEAVAAAISIPADEQRMVYKGRVLKDQDSVAATGIDFGHTVHVVKGVKPAASTTAGTTAAPATVPVAAAAAPQPSTATTAPSQAPAAANPYAQLFGGGGFGGGAMPPAGAEALGGMAAAPQMAWPGFGMGGMGGMPGMGGGDPAAMQAMMQNPLMRQMALQMMRNPQVMQQMMATHPLLQSLPPQQRDEMARMMQDPAVMEQVAQLMANGGGMPGMGGMGGGMGGGTPAANPFFAGAQQPTMRQPAAPPGDLRTFYAAQLEQLRSMGFPNDEANIIALQQAEGDVSFAVSRLLGN